MEEGDSASQGGVSCLFLGSCGPKVIWSSAERAVGWCPNQWKTTSVSMLAALWHWPDLHVFGSGTFLQVAAATMEQYQLVQKHNADSSSLVDVGTTMNNNSCLGSAANHDFSTDRCWQHECTNRKTARPCLRFLLSQDPKAWVFEASKPLISKYWGSVF